MRRSARRARPAVELQGPVFGAELDMLANTACALIFIFLIVAVIAFAGEKTVYVFQEKQFSTAKPAITYVLVDRRGLAVLAEDKKPKAVTRPELVAALIGQAVPGRWVLLVKPSGLDQLDGLIELFAFAKADFGYEPIDETWVPRIRIGVKS